MKRTSTHTRDMAGQFLCTFLVGLCLASSAQGKGEQRAIARYHAAAGQFFQLHHGIAPRNLGENVTLTWSRGAKKHLEWRSETSIRIINGSLLFLPVEFSDSGYYTWNSSDVKGAWRGEEVFLSVVRGVCPHHSDVIPVQKGTSCKLHCGLERIFALDKSREISWLKDCNPMNYSENIFRISKVNDTDGGNYTCLINFTFEGKKFNTSRTIQLRVEDDPASLDPKVNWPRNSTIKVKPGVKAELDCKVFMGKNKDIVGETRVYWLVNHSHIELCKNKDLLNTTHEDSADGAGVHRLLRLAIAQVQPEFFHVPFQCVISNSVGQDTGVVWLIPDDTDYHLLIFLCAAVPLIVAMAILYRCFKVDVVLAYRSFCPLISNQRKLDGKLHDAYVSCLHSEALCSSQLENFCLQVLPEVLEHRYGYSLFIRGRDNLPGEAAQNVISEAIRKSRRLIIVVSAQNKSALGPEDQALQGQDTDRDVEGGQADFEQQIGLYDALVENRLRVVLVELGRGVEYSLLPESIGYLKRKHGALRWRPSHGDPTAHPNCQFWKYLRYHMPHRPEASTSIKLVHRRQSQGL